MKNTTRLIAALVVAFSLLGTHKVSAQSSCPAFIPTASTMEGLYDYAVTNQPVYNGFTMCVDGSTVIYDHIGTMTNYSSFAQYHTELKNDVLKAVATLLNDGLDPNTPIRLSAHYWYNSGVAYNVPYLIDTNGTRLGDMTADWFDSVSPRYLFIIIPVKGLLQFTVNVSDSNPPYSGGWSASGGAQPKVAGAYPPERTMTDCLVLNPWYLLRQNNACITVTTTNRQTITYTRNGNERVAPTVAMLDKAHLQVTCSSGADTTIESSTDLVTWKPYLTIYGYSGITNEVVDIDTSSPARFFRAYSQ